MNDDKDDSKKRVINLNYVLGGVLAFGAAAGAVNLWNNYTPAQMYDTIGNTTEWVFNKRATFPDEFLKGIENIILLPNGVKMIVDSDVGLPVRNHVEYSDDCTEQPMNFSPADSKGFYDADWNRLETKGLVYKLASEDSLSCQVAFAKGQFDKEVAEIKSHYDTNPFFYQAAFEMVVEGPEKSYSVIMGGKFDGFTKEVK